MAFLFTNSDSVGFNNLSNSQKEIFSAERRTLIHSVLITNKTNSEIRVNLEIAKTLVAPYRTSIAQYRRVLKKGSEELLVIKNNVDDTTSGLEPTERELVDGDNLICFSNGSSELFDCTIWFTELMETEELI